MKETEAFRVLSSADRQLLLQEMVQTEGGMTEEELARRVAARRHGISPESVDESKFQRAHIRISHNHLPQLRDLDIIEEDGDELVLADTEQRKQLFEVATNFDGWPPDDLLQSPTS